MQLTFTFHYRIHGLFLKELKEGVSELRFSIEYERWESSNENTEHFANIWKVTLAPFAPSKLRLLNA